MTKNKTIRKLLKVLAAVAAVTLVLVSTYFYAKFSKIVVKKNADEQLSEALTQTEDKSLDILLLGYGGPGHEGSTLSDSLILLHTDMENKKVALITIPRDLWVPIPYDWDNTKNYKINMAYAIGLDEVRYANKKPEFRGDAGGGQMAKHVVGEVTGIKVENFISVNFGGLIKIIDILGGIEVDVPKTFDDYFYPIEGKENEICGLTPSEIAQAHAKYSGFDLEKQFKCRYEHLHFDSGKQKLDGVSALKFVRSRHADAHGGDFARSERQYALLVGLKEKLFSLSTLGNLVAVLDQLTETVTTDLDLGKIDEFASILPGVEEFEVKAIYLTEENILRSDKSSDGQFILVSKEGINKWIEVQQFISAQLSLAQ